MGAAFGSTVIVVAAVMLAIAAGWETEFETALLGLPDQDDVGRLGVLITGIIGLAGIGAAALWRNHVTDQPVTGARALTSFIVATAIAEAGMFVGLVFSILAEALLPFWLGAALFILSLVVMLTGLGQIDLVDT